MTRINLGRLVAGGLLAGLVINLVELVCGMLFVEPWKAALAAHSLTAPEGATGLALYWALGFAAGLVVLWFYAAARPRFGPGPKTAAMVAVAFWVPYYALCSAGLCALGLFPRGMLAASALIGLVGLVVATIAGAWVYREP